jgi:hypothetical protein
MNKSTPEPGPDLVDERAMQFLLRPVLLHKPEWVVLSAWTGHVPFAFWLMEAMRPRTLVELGVHAGLSYCTFCQAAVELNTATRCWGVDHWQGDAHTGDYDKQVLARLESFHQPRYSTFSKLLRSSFDDAGRLFADGSVDLLHIDGYHTYEAVSHDFETWLPKMSARGLVLFHDTQVMEREFGVQRFWQEISQRFPHFEFLHSNGLGVLAVGGQQAPAVRWLTQPRRSDDPEAGRIRELFARLGQTLAMDERTSRQLGDALNDNARYLAKIQQLQLEIRNLRRFSLWTFAALLRWLSKRFQGLRSDKPG